ncbi:MAG: glycosyltransferase family 1 protein, partial [Steroidobacteraceae bacterium]
MRIAIVTDAWHPQVNGVVRTLATTAECLRSMGHET